jgi:hypothetical protein
MANILASAIVDQAEEILQDSSNTRWTQAELLAWLNQGMRVIVKEKPDANPSVSSVLLASGLWQTLPTGGIILLDAFCNMGTTGTTRGAPVTVVDRRWMDTSLPTWTTETASTTVKHVVYDPKTTPKKFMVYPQSPGTNYLEIVVATMPTSIAIDASITLGDEHADTLLDYILFRAFSRDADYVQNAERAIAHYQSFLTSLGKLDQMELLINAKRGQGGK